MSNNHSNSYRLPGWWKWHRCVSLIRISGLLLNSSCYIWFTDLKCAYPSISCCITLYIFDCVCNNLTLCDIVGLHLINVYWQVGLKLQPSMKCHKMWFTVDGQSSKGHPSHWVVSFCLFSMSLLSTIHAVHWLSKIKGKQCPFFFVVWAEPPIQLSLPVYHPTKLYQSNTLDYRWWLATTMVGV